MTADRQWTRKGLHEATCWFGRALKHYNSATVAVDVEALRRALEVNQWVLFGHSYGARCALTIARDFPASVEAMVLAAPAFPGPPRAETRARDMDRALERGFDHCSRIGSATPTPFGNASGTSFVAWTRTRSS